MSCFLTAGVASQAAEPPPLEYQVKAAFLLNFTKFVEWPPESFADAASPIAICVVGDAPIGPVLEQMVEGESVGGRKIAGRREHRPIRRNGSVEMPGSVCRQDRKRSAQTSWPSLGRSVLTVGETDDFLADGGMINFVIENRRVRFDINQKAVGNSALKLSSKLFNVARQVEK